MINFGSHVVRSFTWTNWKSVSALKNLVPQCDDDGSTYTIYGYDDQEIILCTIWKDTVPDGVLQGGYTQEQNDADRTEFEAKYKPKMNRSISPRTADGKSINAIWPTEGSKKTFVSCDWTDRTTWCYSAIRVVDEVATCLNDPTCTSYSVVSGNLIDVYHGKITGEDFLKDAVGNSFRVQVKVNGTSSLEQDPHFSSGSDHIIDYNAGRITFLSGKQSGDVVTVTYHYGKSSVFVIKPDPGKILKIKDVEVQFANDIFITDSVRFQPYGLVEIFAPQYCPSPYPSGTLIPLGNPSVYKTMNDYVNEANGAYPIIPKMTSSFTPNWRQLDCDVITFPWHYAATSDIDSSKGMEVRISLQHDTPFSGSTATATFYCLSIDA